MKLTSLFDVLTTSEQCFLDLKSLQTVFFMASLGKFGAVHCVHSVMIIVSNILHLSTLNLIGHFSDQLTKFSRLDCSCISSTVVVTLSVIFNCRKIWYLTGGNFVDIIDRLSKKNGVKYRATWHTAYSVSSVRWFTIKENAMFSLGKPVFEPREFSQQYHVNIFSLV